MIGTIIRRVLLALAITALIGGSSLAVVTHDEKPASAQSGGDIWCYVYSTALGFWNPYVGAAAGAYCLFLPNSSTVYQCWKPQDVTVIAGIRQGKYGHGPAGYRHGRCYDEEWGYMNTNWMYFPCRYGVGRCPS